jgi:hypothetical protein
MGSKLPSAVFRSTVVMSSGLTLRVYALQIISCDASHYTFVTSGSLIFLRLLIPSILIPCDTSSPMFLISGTLTPNIYTFQII